jgi:membrane-associated phospholipid phosphatase
MSPTTAWGGSPNPTDRVWEPGPWPRPFCSGSQTRGIAFGGPSRRIIPLIVILVPLFLAGCGTLENGRGWGQDALWPVDLERIARAGRDALLSPATWVPLAGAGVFALGDLDERVSDWASEHNPLFRSQSAAADASNYLSGVLCAEVLGTALATPSGDTPGAWVLAKLKGGAVELGAIAVTDALTAGLKDGSNRERPDGSDHESFPSGHTSNAFAFATLANRNLESIDFLEGVRPPLQIANTVLASGVAWARVEARKHHPSDVLFGAALGHFVTAFLHDAFLNLPEDSRVDFEVFSTGDGAGLSLCWRF